MDQLVQITRLSRSEFYEIAQGFTEKIPEITPQIPLWQLSKYVSNRIVTDESEPIPDCVTCGACCMYARVVAFSRAESENIKAYWDITLDGADDVVIERVFPLGSESGHCVNLEGTVGHEVGCRIYPDRPHVCSDFEPGSDRCHGFRRKAGIEPSLSDDAVASALREIRLQGRSGRILQTAIELESTSVSFDTRAAAGEQTKEYKTARIIARMDDETIRVLHTYDTSTAEWFEHELEGCTLDEAKELIEKRKAA
jgi:uncharacterized protein